MPLVLVLPCESALALGLLPEDLKHGAVVHEVEAFIDCLQSHSSAMDLHLIHEVFTLPNSGKNDR